MKMSKRLKLLASASVLLMLGTTLCVAAENGSGHNRSFWRQNEGDSYSHGIDATQSDSVWESNGRIEIVDGNDTIAFDPKDLEIIGQELRSINSDVNEINSNLSVISIYVGSDGKLHFVDAGGADTTLNFSRKPSTIKISLPFRMIEGSSADDGGATQVITCTWNGTGYSCSNSLYEFAQANKGSCKVRFSAASVTIDD